MRVVDALLRLTGKLAAPSGRNARLPILFYHRVLDQPDALLPDVPDARLFEVHMDTLARVFDVISLEDGVAALQNGTLGARSVCVTFDDGYRDNVEIAFPILRRHGLTATFFVSTGFLEGGRMFVDTIVETVRRIPDGIVDLTWLGLGRRQLSNQGSRCALIEDLVASTKYRPVEERDVACERLAELAGAHLPNDLMMTAEQLRTLHRAGMSIGGHTVDHPILTCQTHEEARSQIIVNRNDITSITGSRPAYFAYPNGRPDVDYGQHHVEMVKEAGYVGALTTAWGSADSRCDPFQIPRVPPWQQSSLRLYAGLLRSVHVRRRHLGSSVAGVPGVAAAELLGEIF